MKNSSGVTLIETIMVILLLLVLAAMAIPRVSGVDAARVNAASRTAAGDIRYAQSLAIATQRNHHVVFTGGGTYRIEVNNAGVWAAVSNPAKGGAYTVSLSADYPGVAINNNYTVEFNQFGEPVAGAGGAVTLSYGGGAPARTISVAAVTGKVTIN